MKKTKVLRFKRLRKEAVPFDYKSADASCFDLASAIEDVIPSGATKLFPTGWAFEIPEGFEVQIRPRSGLSLKEGLVAILGTIDADYRGEVGIILHNNSDRAKAINIGDRIAQGKFSEAEQCFFMESNELSETERGTKGFGSSGIKS